MRIVFFEIELWEEEFLKSKLKGNDLVFFSDELSEKNIFSAEKADIISVFIYSKLDKKVLSRLPNLKAVITRSTGFDHIDVKECNRRKIKVYNVPFYGENTVAEHTFALILSLTRKIHKSYERTVRGDFSLDNLRGFDLKGKTIGIIGLGHIGRHVARIACGFEMKILGYDVKKDINFAKKMKLKYVNLNELLEHSDIITLHCPYNKKTHHLINKNNIKQIKKGALIINTARGGNIETRALAEGLANGQIGGAGLDVLEEESIIKEEIQLLSKNYTKDKLQNMIENHILLTFDNVIVTPHNAFNSQEALLRILETTIENINAFKNKKKGNLVG